MGSISDYVVVYWPDQAFNDSAFTDAQQKRLTDVVTSLNYTRIKNMDDLPWMADDEARIRAFGREPDNCTAAELFGDAIVVHGSPNGFSCAEAVNVAWMATTHGLRDPYGLLKVLAVRHVPLQDGHAAWAIWLEYDPSSVVVAVRPPPATPV